MTFVVLIALSEHFALSLPYRQMGTSGEYLYVALQGGPADKMSAELRAS